MSFHLGHWFLLLLILTGCTSVKTTIDYEHSLRAFQKGLYAEADLHLRSALQKRPQDEKLLSLQGWVFFKMGRLDEAEIYFEKASQLQPNNIATVEGLAWIYYLRGLNEAAQKNFSKMIDHATRHLLNSSWPDYPEADRRYLLSIHSSGNYGLGLIAKRMGQWHKAHSHLEEALKQPNLFIDAAEIRFQVAEILFTLRRYDLALPHYKKLIPEDEVNFLLLNRYAWCLYQVGETEEAKSIFLKSKRHIASAEEGYRRPSMILSVTEKLIAKRMAEPHYGLALIYVREKNLSEAIKELTLALQLSPFFHSPDEIVTTFSPFPVQ
jgi:tetratricopeptide (TPR) repeat protein